MLTIGDVALWISLVLAFAASAWSAMMLSALLFREAGLRSGQRLERSLLGSFLAGLAWGLPVIFIGAVLLNAPSPIGKLFGFLVLMVLLMIGLLGGGGIAFWAAAKIEEQGGSETGFEALAKGSALAVGACVMPVFGWLFLAPFLLFASLGACAASLFRPRSARAADPAP